MDIYRSRSKYDKFLNSIQEESRTKDKFLHFLKRVRRFERLLFLESV